MQAYCMKCRKKVEVSNPRAVTLKNGRPAVVQAKEMLANLGTDVLGVVVNRSDRKHGYGYFHYGYGRRGYGYGYAHGYGYGYPYYSYADGDGRDDYYSDDVAKADSESPHTSPER